MMVVSSVLSVLLIVLLNYFVLILTQGNSRLNLLMTTGIQEGVTLSLPGWWLHRDLTPAAVMPEAC